MPTDSACDALEVMPDAIHPGILREDGDPVLIYVSPRGDLRVPGSGPAAGRVTRTFSLDEALGVAGAGTTVQLLPGKYYRPAELIGVRATEERPLVIRGTSDGGAKLAQICGANAPTPIYPDLPERDDWAYLKLIRCENIVIEDLAVESCWPCFIYAEDCRNITLRDVRARDGLYLLFSRGSRARGFLIEDNDWTQDPTGTMWRELAFEDLHHGLYGYYNGALFGSLDCEGDVVFRRNRVRHAFNGIRMSCSSRGAEIETRCNIDVVVSENCFEYIRDNAVEPEATAVNWHVRHNRFRNCHAALSFHAVLGGWWYIYGNEGWFDDRPGLWYQDNRGGTILKLHDEPPFPREDGPWFFFNNSWYTRTFLLKRSRTRQLTHVNNAYLFCNPADHPPCECRADRELLKDFPAGDAEWDPTVRFDHDLSSKPFGLLRCRHGQEEQGLVADPCFADPRRGDFRLNPDSKARGRGTPLVLRAGRDWSGDQDWPVFEPGGPAPDIGARQGDTLIRPIPFRPVSLASRQTLRA